MNKEYLKLYANCILVRGAITSTINDLHRNKLYTISNNQAKYILDLQSQTKGDLDKYLTIEHVKIVSELITFLIDNELGFMTDEGILFPELSTEWDEPYTITNAIIDISTVTNNIKFFIDQIGEFGCHTLQIRMFSACTFSKIAEITSFSERTNIQSVELYIHYDSCTYEELVELCDLNKRISIILIYSSPTERTVNVTGSEFGTLVYIENEVTGNKNCGCISPYYFTINIKTFTESLHHNSCLNRKISIDAEGNIKNCPSMAESYGNIRDTTLAEAIKKPGFKKYWDINKDKIHVCKDCEFRYICTDCRAYVEDPDDILSKPLKCGYNPYTGEWSEWSTNPLKQKAIDFYGMREMLEKSESPYGP